MLESRYPAGICLYTSIFIFLVRFPKWLPTAPRVDHFGKSIGKWSILFYLYLAQDYGSQPAQLSLIEEQSLWETTDRPTSGEAGVSGSEELEVKEED